MDQAKEFYSFLLFCLTSRSLGSQSSASQSLSRVSKVISVSLFLKQRDAVEGERLARILNWYEVLIPRFSANSLILTLIAIEFVPIN